VSKLNIIADPEFRLNFASILETSVRFVCFERQKRN